MKDNLTKRNLILLAFVILKFLIQYVLRSSYYDLHADELLYLDQANHLAWGYFSVPPFMSWISYLIHTLGGSLFWIKFFPALFGALTIVVVWKAVEELGGSLFALVLSATGVLFSALLLLNIYYQPNSFDVLCWTMFYLVMIKYFKTNNLKWIYIAALIFAIGFLNKYNIIFLIIGFLPAVLITQHRNLLTKKELYFAIILALLVIFPNLLWQYNNNFPFIQHLNELKSSQLDHVSRLDFIKFQLLFFLGSLPVIVAALYALLVYKPFKNYKTFFWVMVFTLFVFIYFRANSYYAMGLYPIYIAFGAVFLGHILTKRWTKLLKGILIILPILFFIPVYNVVIFSNKTPEYFVNKVQKHQNSDLLRRENGNNHPLYQDFEIMLGWRALAEKVDSICSELPNLDHILILCDDYGQAGAINYYTKNKNIRAHSYHETYIDWVPLDKKIENVVLVKWPYDRDRNRTKETPFFDTVYLADMRVNPYAREDTIFIYVLKGAKIDVSEVIKDEVNELKNRR
ncbi:MAG: glycosyltransferase family 39 protein [Bacteroidales bacterium]|nr:glycosyltransferase family 39 protein [Bacteroidales bacterium]